jgi:hypothetical protein
MTELPEPLEHPPSVEDGDNSQAGGGAAASPVEEGEIEDAPELDEDDSDPDEDSEGDDGSDS